LRTPVGRGNAPTVVSSPCPPKTCDPLTRKDRRRAAWIRSGSLRQTRAIFVIAHDRFRLSEDPQHTNRLGDASVATPAGAGRVLRHEWDQLWRRQISSVEALSRRIPFAQIQASVSAGPRHSFVAVAVVPPRAGGSSEAIVAVVYVARFLPAQTDHPRRALRVIAGRRR
jgi:hypothetical protein